MTPAEPAPADLTLRPLAVDDPAEVAAVVEVHLAARAAAEAAGWMPAGVHPPHEVREWLTGRVREDETWVAVAPGPSAPAVQAYARLTATWLDDLYVHPAAAGRGVGRALVELAQALRPDGFGLWVFACNAPARRLYAACGLVEVEHTDGAGNEERAPDVRVVWERRPGGPGGPRPSVPGGTIDAIAGVGSAPFPAPHDHHLPEDETRR